MSNALDRLTIRGFKSIRELNDFKLGNLNVFIGGNGAGKSNLIEFFRMLQKVMNGDLNEYIFSGGGVSDFLFNGREVTPKMYFETHFGVRGYRFSIVPGPKGNCAIFDEARYYEPGEIGWWKLGSSSDGTSMLVDEAKGKDWGAKCSKRVLSSIASWKIYHFHDTRAKAGMRNSEIVQDNKYLRFDASNIAPYLLRLKKQHADVYQEIVDSIRLVMPFFDKFLLEVDSLGEIGEKQKVSLSWLQKGSDYPMQPYHLSDGSIRFICLATALLQPDPPAAIIIDEPELGLHPSAISILAELIQDASRRTQMIVATQSPALVDHFEVEDVIVVNREDGASTFKRLQLSDFSSWLETYSVGELWSKNVISGGPVYE